MRHHKNLILKDCYLRLDQIKQIGEGFLEVLLEQMILVLKNHIDSCEDCAYAGDHCICCQEIVKRYDINHIG
jgi:hypothetical protein